VPSAISATAVVTGVKYRPSWTSLVPDLRGRPPAYSRSHPVLVDCRDGLDYVGLLGGLVEPVALDARKSQRDSSRIANARLDSVECNLDDHLSAEVRATSSRRTED
jgi:hypothetical protein